MTAHKHHRHEHHEENGEDGRGEFLSDSAGKIKDFAMERFGGEDDAKIIHCSKCHNAEKTEKLIKSTLLVSICAFILSIVSLALPFFNSVQFSAEEWEIFLNKLGESAETGVPADPEPEDPAAAVPKPAKPAVAKSSAPSVRSSVAVLASSAGVPAGGDTASVVASSVPSSEAPRTSSDAAVSEASSAEAVSSVETQKSEDSVPADGSAAQKDPTL